MLGDVLSDTLALAPGGGCVAIVVVGIRPMDARGLVPGDDSGRGFLRPGISSVALSTANSYTHLKFFITRRAWSDLREASCRRDIKYKYSLPRLSVGVSTETDLPHATSSETTRV